MQHQYIVKESNSIQQVTLPNGEQLSTKSYIYEPVVLAGQILPPARFYVLNMQPAVVLGMEFLRARSVSIDFASLKFTFSYKQSFHDVYGFTNPKTSGTRAMNAMSCSPQCFRVNHKQFKRLTKDKSNQIYLLTQLQNEQTIQSTYPECFNLLQKYPWLESMYSPQDIQEHAVCAKSHIQQGFTLLTLACPCCSSPVLDKVSSVKHTPILTCQKCQGRFVTRNHPDVLYNLLGQFKPILHDDQLQFSSVPVQTRPDVSPSLLSDVRKIYTAHKMDVDQFLYNVFEVPTTKDVTVSTSTVHNTLYINNSQGRESYSKLYENNTLYFHPSTTCAKPQVIACNTFKSLPIYMLKQVLSVPNTYFLDNTFIVQSQKDIALVKSLVQNMPNVIISRIQQEGTFHEIDTYHALKPVILRCGDPYKYLLNQLYNTMDLPKDSLSHILAADTDDIRADIRTLLQEYSNVFPDDLPLVLPPDRNLGDVHRIVLSSSQVVAKPPYRTGPSESAIIKKDIDEMLAAGIIRPSNSQYASPILLVKKKDQTLRFCIDYRALNEFTVKDKYPLPKTDELIDKLAGAKYFTSLDLRSGYWQLRMDPQDIYKTAFTTRYGHYEFLVMPFGLTNAPSTFQRTMNNLFKPYLDQFVVVYLDDILIFSKTLQDHKQHIRKILDLLQQNQFYAKLKKCAFYRDKVTFLGHEIDRDGLHIDQDKIRVVKTWPIPKTRRQVQSFVGFAQYFRQYIRGFSEIALPLTRLSSKNVVFVWDESCQHAFDTLIAKLCSAPVLHIYDPNGSPLEIHTDASQVALSGVLYQPVAGKLKPIAFYSRKFSQAELNYTVTEKELLAIVASCRHWRHYVYGSDFTVRTDHRPLQFFFTQPNLTPRQLRWAEYLSDFQPGLKILYLAGRHNVPSDALSRNTNQLITQQQQSLDNQQLINQLSALAPSQHTTEPFLSATSNYQLVDLSKSSACCFHMHQSYIEPWFSDLASLQAQDATLKGVSKLAITRDDRFHIRDNVLFTKANQVVLPNCLIPQVLDEYHTHSGHFGIRHTIDRLKQRYWFPKMEYIVRQYVRDCDLCQRIKSRHGKQHGLLQPLPVPSCPWQHLSMDFVTDLPVNMLGGTSLLVVVDRFSKMAHICQMPQDTTAYTVAKIFLDNVVRLHGVPLSIVSDRDPRFTSKFWQELLKLLGTQCKLSTAFHPQSDGQTERTIRTIEQLLRAYIHANPQQNYYEFLAQVELAYNTTPHSSTKQSPFEICYGSTPCLPVDLAINTSTVPSAQALLQRLQQTWTSVRKQLQITSQNMERYTNAKRQDAKFSLNDYVLLNTQNLHFPAYTSKFKPRFIGPFRIIKLVGKVAVKLEIPDSLRIHPVFHISLLKQYNGRIPLVPAPIVINNQEEYEVEFIVAHRMSRRRFEYLVRWKGFDASSDEWLPASSMLNAQQLVREYHEQHGIPFPS